MSALAQEQGPREIPGRRLPWLDVLKGVAIALVLFNHAVLWPARAGDGVASFVYGLPFGTVGAFCAVAGYLAGRRARGAPTHVKRRALQLLVPWAIWAPLYALGPVVWQLLGGGALPVGFEPVAWAGAVLTGGGPLWFLPVLFAVTATASALDTGSVRWSPLLVSVGLYVAIAVASTAAGLSPIALGRGTFWGIAPIYLGSYWFGLHYARTGLPSVPRGVAWALIVLTMAAAGACTFARDSGGSVGYSWAAYAVGAVGGWVAVPLAVRATRAPGVVARAFAAAGEASLGVYVLHPLLLGPAMAALPGWRTIAGSAALSVAVLAMSTVFVLRVRQRWPEIAARIL